MATGTQIFVQRDGIVNHRHDGVKGLHDPATRHGTDLHSAHAASKPTNAKELNADQAAQYKAALGGKSFNHLWVAAKNARKEAAGEAWNYGKRERGEAAPDPLAEAKAAAVKLVEEQLTVAANLLGFIPEA